MFLFACNHIEITSGGVASYLLSSSQSKDSAYNWLLTSGTAIINVAYSIPFDLQATYRPYTWVSLARETKDFS